MISVVIPTLNAAARLADCLSALVPAAVDAIVREVVLVDGGSTDETLDIAEDAGAKLIRGEPGRGRQIAAGCAAARGDWLLVLHADTVLDPDWAPQAALHSQRRGEQRAAYFRFALDDPAAIARVWETGVALRCALLALPYGDQGLLIPRATLEAVGGYRPLPLMEDVDLVRRLGRSRLVGLPARAVTSAERYRRDGYPRRSLANVALLARYLTGTPPERLARDYG